MIVPVSLPVAWKRPQRVQATLPSQLSQKRCDANQEPTRQTQAKATVTTAMLEPTAMCQAWTL